jgi:hypothetical protein
MTCEKMFDWIFGIIYICSFVGIIIYLFGYINYPDICSGDGDYKSMAHANYCINKFLRHYQRYW